MLKSGANSIIVPLRFLWRFFVRFLLSLRSFASLSSFASLRVAPFLPVLYVLHVLYVLPVLPFFPVLHVLPFLPVLHVLTSFTSFPSLSSAFPTSLLFVFLFVPSLHHNQVSGALSTTSPIHYVVLWSLLSFHGNLK